MTQLERALKVVESGDWNSADLLLDGCGIEYIRNEEIGVSLKYINMGDTYTTTICQEEDEPPFIGCWGDWIEGVENEHCKENDVICCSYCSKFTPMNEDDWRDVVCESCGNLMGG